MTLVTLSTFLCLIVVNLHFRGDRRKEVPFWLRKLAIHHGARLLFVNAEPPKSSGPKKANKPLKKITAATNAVMASINHSSAYPSSMKYGYNEFPYGNPRMLRSNQGSEQFGGERLFPTECQCGYNQVQYKHSQMPISSTEERIMPQFCPDNMALFQQQREYQMNMKSYPQPSRNTDLDEDAEFPSCAFCPACAGLAAAAAAAANTGLADINCPSYREQQLQPGMLATEPMIEDPTDELAAVWAAAVSESKAPSRGDVYDRQVHQPAREDESDEEDDEENEDDEDDDQLSNPDRTLGPDLESFLLHCIRPGASKMAVNAANARWNNSTVNALPNSPFYPFTSPICRDESEEEERDGPNLSNLQYREVERLQNDSQYNDSIRATNIPGLPRTNSGSCNSVRPRKCSVEVDSRLKKRVAMLTRDVSDIVKGIRYMQKQNEKKEKVNKLLADWRAVGMVLDRLFFVIYLCALGISILLYFPRSGDDSEEGSKS